MGKTDHGDNCQGENGGVKTAWGKCLWGFTDRILFSNWKRLIAPTSILFEASFLHVYFCAISSFIFQRKYNKMDQSKHTHRAEFFL